MELKIFQVDAFAEKLFEGNPAAVIPLEEFLPDEVLQKIASENNLSETAFFIPLGNDFHLRWFTPAAEVKLCGHATLATAHVLFHHLNFKREEIRFQSLSGWLTVSRKNDLLVLDFPSDFVSEIKATDELLSCFNHAPINSFKGKTDVMMVFENEEQVKTLDVNFMKLKQLPYRGVIATSAGEKFDFVSRFFAPAFGINEDPVTGSAHTLLIPYWAKQLGKNSLTARQISNRGGTLYCEWNNDRVKIGGKAITYLTGAISV